MDGGWLYLGWQCVIVMVPSFSLLVEEHIQEQLQAAKPEPVVEEIDLNNLAPRKPDWLVSDL